MKHVIYAVLVICIVIGCFYALKLPISVLAAASSQSEAEFVITHGSSSSPVSVPSWNIVASESGVTLYREDSPFKNYLVIVDPSQTDISVIQSYSHLDDHWDQVSNPVCVFNGTFFEPDGSATFPLIVDHMITPGGKTDNFPVRMMYFDPGRIRVLSLSSNANILDATSGIAGLDPVFYERDSVVTNRIIIAEKNGLLYIIVTQNRTVNRLVEFLTSQMSVDPGNIIALDSGFSTQFRCFDQDYLKSSSIIGSSLVISR